MRESDATASSEDRDSVTHWVSVLGRLSASDGDDGAASLKGGVFDSVLDNTSRFGWLPGPAGIVDRPRPLGTPTAYDVVPGWAPLEGGEDWTPDGRVRELGWIYVASFAGRSPVQPLCLLVDLALREIGGYCFAGLDITTVAYSGYEPAMSSGFDEVVDGERERPAHAICDFELIVESRGQADIDVDMAVSKLGAALEPHVVSLEAHGPRLTTWSSRSGRAYGPSSFDSNNSSSLISGTLRVEGWELLTAARVAEWLVAKVAIIGAATDGDLVSLRLHQQGLEAPAGAGGWTQ